MSEQVIKPSGEETIDPKRAAIEQQLRDRLTRDRATAAPATMPAGSPLSSVGLMCLACRGLSAGDASFCTQCGTRFNAMVVARSGS